MEFNPFPKIPRLSRDIVISEKIDGTNASIFIKPRAEMQYYHLNNPELDFANVEGYAIHAASRTRWITRKDDNYGFASWVHANAHELVRLGPGHHFGEWWGQGIQRNYGLKEKRFSLFNLSKWWRDDNRPKCCEAVPLLYAGAFRTDVIDELLMILQRRGSFAAPGFMKPEGVIIYHTAGNFLFKKTLEKDESPKSI